MMVITSPHIANKELYDDKLIDEALKVKVTNRMVNQLKKEYEKLKNVING
jgi:hypothetical protein